MRSMVPLAISLRAATPQQSRLPAVVVVVVVMRSWGVVLQIIASHWSESTSSRGNLVT